MREEVVSSQNVNTSNYNNSNNETSLNADGDQLRRRKSSSPPQTPAASSAGASSPAVLVNAGCVEWLGHGEGSSQPSCRPWDRGDLLRRLATFKPSNWHGKPKAAGALACAQRGWVNIHVDKIQCESCGANLKYAYPSTSSHCEVDSGEKFAKHLDEGHKSSCPWRGNTCPESLVQFPPTPPSALIGGYRDRCDGLLQFYGLPIVSASAIEQLRVSRGRQIDRFLAQPQFYPHVEIGYKIENVSGTENSREESLNIYSRAQKLISLCGWEPRWLLNIQDCEEFSAQSARNQYPSGPTKDHALLQDPSPSRNQLSTSSRKVSGNYEVIGPESKSESRSPLLDCSLCGVTIRIWDFLSVSRPARFAPSNVSLPEASKKMGITRGASAASGINGWVGNEGMDQETNEDVDEAATSEKRRSASNAGPSLNQTIAGASSSAHPNASEFAEPNRATNRGKELLWRQPSGSEVGDRAASYESRGPTTRKRSMDDGGSTVDRPYQRIQQADSVEGVVVDRDADEVIDGKRFSVGPSKRARDFEAYNTYHRLYRAESSIAGPSHSLDVEMEKDANRSGRLSEGNEQVFGFLGNRDSTRASSVIAMDTVYHSGDGDSMESVENHPGDFDDINFPSATAAQSVDINELSELNVSLQPQLSACFQPITHQSNIDGGVSSINDGDGVLKSETITVQGRDGLSLGVSGGSIGMGVSHEAEIHGTDISVHKGDSIVGDIEPVAEIIENQGQTGEFAPDQGLTDDFVPEEIDREGRHGDSQDRVSQSVGRADSGSKIVGLFKTESVESGEKVSVLNVMGNDDSVHPSLSCNAIVCSAYEASKGEVTQTGRASSPSIDFVHPGSSYTANGQGPPNGESNEDEVVEFDPIKHHNCFCPWVNENVAAAGCSSSSSGSSGFAEAVCGWQLTLDALDAFQSQGNIHVQTMESESAASLCKDEHQTPSGKLLKRQSLIRKRGQN